MVVMLVKKEIWVKRKVQSSEFKVHPSSLMLAAIKILCATRNIK